MTKPTVSCEAATARLTSCRKKFDHLWRRRPQLTMRIPIAPGVSLVLIAVTAILVSLASAGPHPPDRVSVAVNEQARRVDVSIDGQPFTSYIWPTTLKKPVLYPLRTSAGTVVTRGFPLEPRPGERVDHPHHVGLWLNHGDVNGFDFWNNSEAIPAKDAAKYGTIVHRAIKSAKSGADKGELQVTEDWTTPDGKTLLREDTTYVFRGGPGLRSIDRITTLTALDQKVTF